MMAALQNVKTMEYDKSDTDLCEFRALCRDKKCIKRKMAGRQSGLAQMVWALRHEPRNAGEIIFLWPTIQYLEAEAQSAVIAPPWGLLWPIGSVTDVPQPEYFVIQWHGGCVFVLFFVPKPFRYSAANAWPEAYLRWVSLGKLEYGEWCSTSGILEELVMEHTAWWLLSLLWHFITLKPYDILDSFVLWDFA